MARNDGQIVIKKYANRRLYNTGTSTYVTLEDLAAMAAMKAVAKDEMAAGVTVVIGQNAATHRANGSMFRPATPPKSTTLLRSIHKVPMGLKLTATNHVQSAQVAMVNE